MGPEYRLETGQGGGYSRVRAEVRVGPGQWVE